jgi:hypothetical protein
MTKMWSPLALSDDDDSPRRVTSIAIADENRLDTGTYAA